MNWTSIKKGETCMWMNTLRKFKNYTRRKVESNKKIEKEREFKMMEFCYTNHTRCQ